MPSNTSAVGGLTIPVPTGGTDSDLADPTLLGLLDFLGFYIRNGLNDKLAEMGGPVSSAAITNACPAANLFPWKPEGTFVRGSLPALFAWEESAEQDFERYATMLRDVVLRKIRVMYVFPQLVKDGGWNNRHGLVPAIGRIMFKAAERQRHPSYGYNGATAGELLKTSIGVHAFDIVEGAEGLLHPVPRAEGTNQRGQVERGYPSYSALFHVWEDIAPYQYDSDTDDLAAGNLNIEVDEGNTGTWLDHTDRELSGA